MDKWTEMKELKERRGDEASPGGLGSKGQGGASQASSAAGLHPLTGTGSKDHSVLLDKHQKGNLQLYIDNIKQVRYKFSRATLEKTFCCQRATRAVIMLQLRSQSTMVIQP